MSLSTHRVCSCDEGTPYVPHPQQPLTVRAGCVAIDVLPDDVLLIIFHFDGPEDADPMYPSWHRLVHVCRRWRSLVFSSPNFLDLRLVCGPRTRMELIGIWPTLPITIRNRIYGPIPDNYDFNAAILHRSRVRQIDLRITSSEQLRRLTSAMGEPFPDLTHLDLVSASELPALPDGFLGGSAPHLQSLRITSIPFPALPKLLLSANGLVCLTLSNILYDGYISPQAIHTSLAMLVNLESLTIHFQSSVSHPDRERRQPPPEIRTVLSSLTDFEFRGVTDYLEDLVGRIDAPLLDSVCITPLYGRITEFSQLGRFIGLTERFQEFNEAHVVFDYCVEIKFLPPTRILDVRSEFRIPYKFGQWRTLTQWRARALTRVLTSFSATFSSVYTVEHLYISFPGDLWSRWSRWSYVLTNMHWLDFFRPFTTVKNLYLCKKVAEFISSALQELVGESVTSAFPALESIFLEELEPSRPVQDAFQQFIAARQLSGHPVAVSQWNRTSEDIDFDFDEFLSILS